MNQTETVGLLAHMSIAWPSLDLLPEAVDLWARHLADVDVTDARDAFDRLVLSDEWPPAVARFREIVRAVVRSHPTPIGLPAPRPPIEETRAALAAARESLRRGRIS